MTYVTSTKAQKSAIGHERVGELFWKQPLRNGSAKLSRRTSNGSFTSNSGR